VTQNRGTARIETEGGQRVINVGKGRYVQYAVEREEAIFTILSTSARRCSRPPGGRPGR
jgi:hypothetical protein